MVLYTKPRAEKRAFEALNAKGYGVYLPSMTTLKQWSDRKKKVTEPLFKSYLFIYCSEADIAMAVRESNIVGVVKFEQQPAIVREEEMMIIYRLEQGVPELSIHHGTLAIGQPVTVTDGPLKGISGILTEIQGLRKVAVSIDTLGVRLLISPDKLLISTKKLEETK